VPKINAFEQRKHFLRLVYGSWPQPEAIASSRRGGSVPCPAHEQRHSRAGLQVAGGSYPPCPFLAFLTAPTCRWLPLPPLTLRRGEPPIRFPTTPLWANFASGFALVGGIYHSTCHSRPWQGPYLTIWFHNYKRRAGLETIAPYNNFL
jgi:hypothetical protein